MPFGLPGGIGQSDTSNAPKRGRMSAPMPKTTSLENDRLRIAYGTARAGVPVFLA